MGENQTKNKSGANDHGFTIQKQVFMYLALVHKGNYDKITYEKTDDVHVAREESNSLAVEVTIDDTATITAKNKKFRKSLRNFLNQYKSSDYENVSFVFMTANQAAEKKGKNFTKDFFDDVLTNSASGEEKKVTDDLKELIVKLSIKDKENICKNFSVKSFSLDSLKHDLQVELEKISPQFKDDDRWYDILQRIFKRYSINQEKHLVIDDIDKKIYEVVESDDLRQVELDIQKISDPLETNFLEKLYEITDDEDLHDEALIDFVSYKNAMEIPNVMELYHYRPDIADTLENMHKNQYNFKTNNLLVEYLKYKSKANKVINNSSDYERIHLLNRVVEGNIEYLSEINKIFWRDDE